MEKDIEVNGKKFIVHELLAIEFDELERIEDSINRVVKLIKLSCNMSDDEYSKLTIKERSKIMKLINELNGWTEDFQKSDTEEEKDSKQI